MKRQLKQIGAATMAALLVTPLALAELTLPSPPSVGYIQDEAEIISVEGELELNAKLKTLEEETTVQMVVVTLPDLQGVDPERMATTIGNEWAVGSDELDNGLVFLVAPNDREVWISTGRGMEGAITDARIGLILDNSVVPYFKMEDYESGILEGMYYLEGLARDEYFDLSEIDPASDVDDVGMWQVVLFILIFFGTLGWIGLMFLAETKSWWLGGIIGGVIGFFFGSALSLFLPFGGPWSGAIIFAALGLLIDYLASKYLHDKVMKITGGTSVLDHFNTSSGSGGGGGFSGGGGSFGGGGGGRSW